MMDDTRLTQVLALLDDARSLLADITEDSPPTRDANRVDAARQFIDAAIKYVQAGAA